MTKTIILATLCVVGFTSASTAAPLTKEGEDLIYSAARCAVSKDHDSAASVVRRLPLNSDEARIEAGWLGGGAECAKEGALVGPAVVLRGAIAQALYIRDFREFGLRPRLAPALLSDLGLPPVNDGVDTSNPEVALARFGDCLARNVPEDTDRLLKSPVDSSIEHAVIAEIQPYFAGCYPKNSRFNASRSTLRGLLALSAYSASTRYWRGEIVANGTR
jgi:hypothetical protein